MVAVLLPEARLLLSRPRPVKPRVKKLMLEGTGTAPQRRRSASPTARGFDGCAAVQTCAGLSNLRATGRPVVGSTA